MKYHLKNLSKWMFRAYIVWSLCLDATVILGLLYYFFLR